ncbi:MULTISPECIES: hypothetical protein [Bacillus cereus group]|uniref:hypothetical protein n=1 Tax=Bacillus cereus group TaxID=86661 RepID=UPI0005CF596E|nr:MULTISPECIES: hypothetical protein [Bacillus cereus group]MDO6634327.1 hypothetical protein [Bacillus thuringiensis]MDO6663562.1 hypothetical protein [Bacillus thuringiensis]MDO6704483.1 hypothetical protein [Bacillus thuringiensis]
MKKIITSSVCSVVLLTSLGTSSAFAAENINISNDEIQQPITNLFEYDFNGVTFSSPEPLTEGHIQTLSSLINNTQLNKKDSTIQYGPAYPGDSGIIVDGPFYKTYTNKDVRAVISAVSWFVAERFKLSKVISGALAAGTFQATELIGPTYVGTWTYKAYDNRANKYRLYATVVHYKHSNYTGPIKVQTYPIGWL